MFGKGSNKLSLSSTAGEILQKVNSAISGKNEKPEEEHEDEVLELTEMVAENELELQTDYEIQEPNSIADEDRDEDRIVVTTKQPKAKKTKTPTSKKIKSTKKTKKTNITKTTEGKEMGKKLVSTDTAEATAALFSKLKESAKNKKASKSLQFESGVTVEELISELIKPYLSQWLDENLPSIVKDTVEKEVKKLLPSDE